MMDATLVIKLQMPMQMVRDLMEIAMLAYDSTQCAFDRGMSLSRLIKGGEERRDVLRQERES